MALVTEASQNPHYTTTLLIHGFRFRFRLWARSRLVLISWNELGGGGCQLWLILSSSTNKYQIHAKVKLMVHLHPHSLKLRRSSFWIVPRCKQQSTYTVQRLDYLQKLLLIGWLFLIKVNWSVTQNYCKKQNPIVAWHDHWSLTVRCM